jgi:DNA-binding transcriptional ArsR family regulator
LSDEETYSLIFKSLNHPIRRRILRMLQDNELSFSQILETLSMDSGHLSYHLESLGDLITRSTDGKYRLSSFGLAAVRLMSGVEEHHRPRVTEPRNIVNTAFKIFSVVLAVALLSISVYAMNLTTQADGELASVQAIPIVLGANQTFSYPVTLTYGTLQSSSTASGGFSIETINPENSFTAWREYFFRFDFHFNTSCYMMITLYDPSGKVLSDVGPLGGPEDVYPGYNFGVGSFATFAAAGTYRIEIQNQKTDLFSANMNLHLKYTSFQRPLFYQGLTGLIIVILYPVIVFSSWLRIKKRPHQSMNRLSQSA